MMEFLEDAANIFSAVSIAYSLIILLLSLKIRTHKSFLPLSIGIFFLGLFSNTWLSSFFPAGESQTIVSHITNSFFCISMLALSRALIHIGLKRFLMNILALPFLVFLLLSQLKFLLGWDYLYIVSDGWLLPTVFYRFVYFPVLLFIFTCVVIALIRKIRQENHPINKKLIKLILAGLLFLILSGVSDLLGFVYFRFGQNPVLSFSSLGTLAFSLYTLFYISEIIVYDMKNKKKVVLDLDPVDSDDEIPDKDLYQSIQQAIIDQKLYEDPDLSLSELADSVGMSRNLVSKCINIYGCEQFSSFMNRFRVDALKVLLADKTLTHISVLDLAFRIGFNSKATVHRAFKKAEDCSPSEFRERFRNSS